MNKLKEIWQGLKMAWQQRAVLGEERRQQRNFDFLPAALEVLERPPSPLGKMLGRTLMMLVVIAISWACIGHMDITAIAEGKIIPNGRIKTIQPLEKGVVKTIYVKEGQRVIAGQALIELDQTLSSAEQIRLTQELRFSQINAIREQVLLTALQNKLPPEPFNIDKHFGNTVQILNLTYAEANSQNQMLAQQWLHYQSQRQSLLSKVKEQQAAYKVNQARLQQAEKTLPLVMRKAKALENLLQKNLTPEMDYLDAEQHLIEQQQSLYSYQAQQEQYKAAIETAKQQLNSLQAETVNRSLIALDEYHRKVKSLTQDLNKANDINAKQILYAPVDGIIQQLAVHTVGGVVTEAQALMQLVPHNDYLEVEAILENKDIGFVYQGQQAEIKINTFNFTKYGVVNAEVIGVTADAIADEVKGLVYKLRLKMAKNQLNVDGRNVDLLPGMTVMAEVKTGQRRIIEYVLSPLMRKVDESVGER